jgi:hypothetical protein
VYLPWTWPSYSKPYVRWPPANTQIQPLPITLYSTSTVLIPTADTSGPTPQTRLHIFTPNPGYQTVNRENYDNLDQPILQEWYQVESLPSEVWAISEVYSTDPKGDDYALRTGGGLSLSSTARQATAEARGFLVLSTTGLIELGLQRPVDMLVEDLGSAKDVAIRRGIDT